MLNYILYCSVLRATGPSTLGTNRHFNIIHQDSKKLDPYGYFIPPPRHRRGFQWPAITIPG
jgi:hypothetical protein